MKEEQLRILREQIKHERDEAEKHDTSAASTGRLLLTAVLNGIDHVLAGHAWNKAHMCWEEVREGYNGL